MKNQRNYLWVVEEKHPDKGWGHVVIRETRWEARLALDDLKLENLTFDDMSYPLRVIKYVRSE